MKKIVWEKWIDPLNTNVDEVEYPGHNIPSEEQSESPVEFLSTEDGFDDKLSDFYEEGGEQEKFTYNPLRIAYTPHGIISLTEHSFASKNFDFWTLHYNSDITNELLKKIEFCDGVETLTPITRYRVRMGFNRILLETGAFNLNELRAGIEDCINRHENSNANIDFSQASIKSGLFEIEEKEKRKKLIPLKKYWCMYFLPNGEYEEFSSEDSEEYMQRLELFQEAKEMAGGEIITYMDKLNDDKQADKQ